MVFGDSNEMYLIGVDPASTNGTTTIVIVIASGHVTTTMPADVLNMYDYKYRTAPLDRRMTQLVDDFDESIRAFEKMLKVATHALPWRRPSWQRAIACIGAACCGHRTQVSRRFSRVGPSLTQRARNKRRAWVQMLQHA